jgi:hypothetical protein
MRSRVRLTLKSLMLVVALAAGSLVLLKPPRSGADMNVEIYGPGTIEQDGTVEVQGGMIRFGEDKETELQADRIVIHRGGTLTVEGKGSITRTTR